MGAKSRFFGRQAAKDAFILLTSRCPHPMAFEPTSGQATNRNMFSMQRRFGGSHSITQEVSQTAAQALGPGRTSIASSTAMALSATAMAAASAAATVPAPPCSAAEPGC